MANIPGYIWPEPKCWLSGSVLHMNQAVWKQRDSFLPLVEPSKWMVVVYVNDVLVYGQVPSTAASNTTAYADELPSTDKTMSVDLAAHGVSDVTPLDPKVTVDQYAATKTAVGWQWAGTDWERDAVQLRRYIDSNAGVPEPLGESWVPLSRCFYDEGAVTPDDFAYTVGDNTSFAPTGSAGMQFQLFLPKVTIDGVQVWTPPELFTGSFSRDITVRLWEDLGAAADPSEVVAIGNATALPGWTNIMFDEPWPAKTNLILDPDAPTDDPFRLMTNPDHDGWYTVGYQMSAGINYRGGFVATYARLYPEHDKIYMSDNYPAGSQLINRGRPVPEQGPEWGPNFNTGVHMMCGPIVTYTPIYAPRGLFVPQIYRRVVQIGATAFARIVFTGAHYEDLSSGTYVDMETTHTDYADLLD